MTFVAQLVCSEYSEDLKLVISSHLFFTGGRSGFDGHYQRDDLQ